MYTKCQQSLKQSEWGSSLTSAEIVKETKVWAIKLILHIQ